MQSEIPLVITTNDGTISGSEILINVFPQKTDGGKYQFTLFHAPGLAYFIELPTLPILGLHEIKGRCFAVTPTKFYEIFNNGTFKELGNVDLKDRVVMDNNGLQIVMVDGIKGYYCELSTGVVNQITDESFYPSTSVTYQDGYFIFNRKDTGEFFISDLLSIFFNPLYLATAEGRPDNLVRVISDHRELFLFGSSSIEVWYNSGSSDFPFERNQGVFIEKGCAAPHTIAKQNNTLYFVGSDLIVYNMSGYSPVRISNNAVENSLNGVDLSDAFAYTYQLEGSLFYVLTIPKSNITWRFDASTGSWHILKSYEFGRHQSNCNAFFNNKNLIGDFQNGRIYQLSNNCFKDDGTTIVREFIIPTVNKGREYISIYSLELDMRSGVGLVTGQGDDPKAMLYVSKDNGKTWGNVKLADIGKIGNYLMRVKWNRLGRSRSFIFKVLISDPVPINIGGAFVEVG